MERIRACALLAVALAAAPHIPAAADEVPPKFCTGQDCLSETVPQASCKGLNCSEQQAKPPPDACAGQNCDPIPDQVEPEPKDETVNPAPD
jgi:hypothetical protein